MLDPNTSVFNGRYALVKSIEDASTFQLWEARDEFGGPLLMKVWPFGGPAPSDHVRALWNSELRHLFRLASLPSADEHLVVLRDAGIDSLHQCFVMAMLAPGLRPLKTVIQHRAQYEWLRNLTISTIRADLWRGIRRLALGLTQIHQQQMLHRAISSTAVLVDPERGPSTLRLGGFEWTVRLGEGLDTDRAATVVVSTSGYSFEHDWIAFGLLTAELMGVVATSSGAEQVLKAVGEKQYLTGDERALFEGLLAKERSARLNQGFEIVRRIDQLAAKLEEPRQIKPDDYLALVAMLGPQRPLTSAITEIDESIVALDIERQRKFVEDDLGSKPRVIRKSNATRETYTLVGNRLRYRLTEFVPADEDAPRGAWDLAFCGEPTELRFSSGDEDQFEIGRIPIRVFTLRAMNTDRAVVERSAISWRSFLPREAANSTESDRLQRFHDFFRVTNQIELLMSDAEIFGYDLIDSEHIEGTEVLRIKQRPRDREAPDFARVQDLPEFLNKQKEEARDGDLVYLGEEEQLDLGREVPRSEFWNVTRADSESGIVELRRVRIPEQAPPQKMGFVRTFGLFGQMSLIRRRKRAIDRLGNHAYLLRALLDPGFTFLDSGAQTLPKPIDPEKIDEAKALAMQSIWRTRPIFALQGPPGTGKTTLVANLLAQIFTDDPVAQVLVTAQAHAAVDVLKDKVSDEVTGISPRPLSVRLPRTKGDVTPDPEYAEQVSQQILEGAVTALANEPDRSALQSRWLEAARETATAIRRGDTVGNAKDFCELVKRSCGITYCTTTAGNLAVIADSTQTFDWSIVEEAGKAHGFDLVLPLQTGHRWLLIGDQDQLPPYRYPDFLEALSNLDVTLKAIHQLPGRAGGQVDVDLINRWDRYEGAEKHSRRELWKNWLAFFRAVHTTCSRAKLPADSADPNQPVGASLAEMLWQQHRMHPTIAELVSTAYYRQRIKSMTVDGTGNPLSRVTHTFTVPAALIGKAILWLDVPWRNISPSTGLPPAVGDFTSDDEANAIALLLTKLEAVDTAHMSLAILSPYRRQVQKVSARVRTISTPKWLKVDDTEDKRRGIQVATVDSFQGNQADVVVVSLVRNNSAPPGKGLGFLSDASRMNVLLSRAERLLVLVGSWEFFENQVQDAPPDADQPLGHWRLAIDYLRSQFEAGAALRLSASSLEQLL